MRILRILFLACLAVQAWVTTVRAEVDFTVPQGWREAQAADPRAQQRAAEWSTRADARLHAVYSPPTADAFAETLAMLETSEPLAPEAWSDVAVARRVLEHIGKTVLAHAEPAIDDIRLEPRGNLGIIRAAFTGEGETVHVAVAPSGPTQTIVLLAVDPREDGLYRPLFDDVVASLDGFTAPVVAFDRRSFWQLVAGGWLLATLVVLFASSRFAEQARDYSGNAKRAAVMFMLLTPMAGALAYFGLPQPEAAFVLAGTSRTAVALDAAYPGVALALVSVLVMSTTRRPKLVRSAPRSGVYADRSGTHPKAYPEMPDPPPPTHVLGDESAIPLSRMTRVPMSPSGSGLLDPLAVTRQGARQGAGGHGAMANMVNPASSGLLELTARDGGRSPSGSASDGRRSGSSPEPRMEDLVDPHAMDLLGATDDLRTVIRPAPVQDLWLEPEPHVQDGDRTVVRSAPTAFSSSTGSASTPRTDKTLKTQPPPRSPRPKPTKP